MGKKDIKMEILSYLDSLLLEQDFPEEVKLDISDYFARNASLEGPYITLLGAFLKGMGSLAEISEIADLRKEDEISGLVQKAYNNFIKVNLNYLHDNFPEGLRGYVDELLEKLERFKNL